MARPRKDPAYRRHTSGQARVTLTDGMGGSKDFLLGEYGTPASEAAYHNLLARWKAAGRTFGWTKAPEEGPGLTVAEVLLKFLAHAEIYYRKPSGRPTGEYQNFIRCLRPLNHLFGSLHAKDFTHSHLKAVRNLYITGYEHPKYGPQKPQVRKSINQNVGRIRHLFKWAADEDLVPDSVWVSLTKVKGLAAGRSLAKEGKRVPPVPRHSVEGTLPYLTPTVRDMVRLHTLTGMRSGELVIMRAIDLDTSGKTWVYRPAEHKTEHRGHTREVHLGPEGQAIVKKYLRPELEAFLFDPSRAREERFKEMRAKRKSKVQPSQVCRKKANPKRAPRNRYTPASYARAIEYGIAKANKANPEFKIPHWHPHQLRHLRATELRKLGGLDLARSVLGHKSLEMTENYAELDRAAAAEVMAKIG